VIFDLQFVLRYCNFLALTRPGDAYSEFLNSTDLAMMPWLRKFQVSTTQLDQHFLLNYACRQPRVLCFLLHFHATCHPLFEMTSTQVFSMCACTSAQLFVVLNDIL